MGECNNPQVTRQGRHCDCPTCEDLNKRYCASCRKRIEQKSLKCPRCGGDMMCAVYMRKRIGQETAKKLIEEIEYKIANLSACRVCDYDVDECQSCLFTDQCLWWQSLKERWLK